ncbi:hypothetical protein [Anatilimnocola floriformis]|uniref:hypothetical protein n=1 Tax=Anatilimnocola floriformis TaxID=2948575 RepID=UPI0020C34D8E|nr:hypothetical protein [Anatilimnocola floriformis]
MMTVDEGIDFVNYAAKVDAAGEMPITEYIVAEEVPDTMPINTNLLGLVELILKRPDRLERVIREPARKADLLPRFLAIALTGFVFFGVALSLIFTSAGQWPKLTPIRDLVAGETTTVIAFQSQTAGQSAATRWLDGSALRLIAAYAIGLVAASGICLPSLYFYGLLSGIRMSMLDVVIQTLKAKATAAVALVGILPIYAALGLGILIFDAPQLVREVMFWLGLVLPFIAGLFGTYSLYRGLGTFADTLLPERRGLRESFLQQLVLSWSACYTAVTPIMIHTLWVALAKV